MTLAVIETHPVQYHAPVYRALQSYGVPVTAIYGSDFSVAGYRDRDFGVHFAWDNDLLSGYETRFMGRVATGGPRSVERMTARGIGKALRQVAPTAVLLVGYSPRFYRDAFLAAQRCGVPLLFRAETTDHAFPRSPLKRLLRDTLLRTIYRSCAALLYIGKRSREHFQRLSVPERRLFFAPYCVDTAPFAPTEADRVALRRQMRAELGLADDRLVLLFTGKLVAHKRPELLLEGVRALPESLRGRVSIVFLGDGELRPELVRQAQVSPRVPITITGFRNQRQLSPYYHAADVLAMPSKGETWGLVINEALHHGLPCVVSDRVGCAPDLIEPGDTGALFAPGDSASLSAALVDAFGLAQQPETRERCRRKVASYTVEQAAAGIADAYSMVTAKAAARAGTA